MGCHTWVYKPIKKSEIENYRHLAIDDYKEYYFESKSEKIIEYDISNEEYGFSWKSYRHFCRHNLRNKKILRKLIRNDKSVKTLRNIVYTIEFVNLHHNNIFYIYNRNYGDELMRVDGYPEIILHSFEETLSFINKNPSLICYYNLEEIEQFWKENPDNIINFG